MTFDHFFQFCGFTLLVAAICAMAAPASAAGFEVGENTAHSVARGGVGVVNKSDPSALYFNPALLPRARGQQVLISSNFLTLDLQFQRNDLVYERGGEEQRRVFDPVENQGGIFVAPFLTASFDIGPENFVLGAGLFGPPAYGNPCYGERIDGECVPDPDSAARGMLSETDILVAYAALGAGYRFDLGEDRDFSVGLTGALAYMQTDFSVYTEAVPGPPPWRESPNEEAFVQARNLTDVVPTGILGLAYSDGPLRLAASYRPPMRWQTSGQVDIDFPPLAEAFGPELSNDTARLETWHAGSLRLGFGLESGVHPADQYRPRWDLEFNVVWENWSVVDHFRIDIDGDIEYRAIDPDEDGQYSSDTLHPIYQAKGYNDTWSLRGGFSWGFNSWLTGHTGAFLETAAQPLAYTSPDFVSWARYSASLGATIHLPANLDLDLGYAYIHSPNRDVRPGSGEVYNPIPLSSCRGPQFDASSCPAPGTPPGNPQNEGQWQAHFQIFSASLSWQY